MGGKGGGSVAPYDQWIEHLASYPQSKQKYEANRGKFATEKEWYGAYGGGDSSPLITPAMSNDIFTKIYGTYKEPPAPAPAPAAAAPAAAAPPPAAPPAEPARPEGGTPIDPGGAIDQPTTLGGDLGGAILHPPKYWVGGLDSYTPATSQSGRGTGALKTTE